MPEPEPPNLSETVRLACELIARPSITPEDEGCQALLAAHLEPLGFRLEHLPFAEVQNLWATHGGGEPRFVFAGHTDVVPTGPESAWSTPPFEPTFKGELLFGRGAADMKGSLAAMIFAAERFVSRHPDHPGTLAFLITSDEEGPARNGTEKVMQTLMARNERIDWCVVGEPSSASRLGDVVRHGRRGSINGHLTVRGIQGHVAYPERVLNPIHTACAALAELSAVRWDEGSADFPPTSFQVSNINAGTGAVNVVPGELEAKFNLRYSTALTYEEIVSRVETVLEAHELDHHLAWTHSGRPFLTRPPAGLLDATAGAIFAELGYRPEFSTSGGTSDGRFIAPTGAQLVELGPINETIHRIDECVAYRDLDRLTDIYTAILESLLGNRPHSPAE